MTDNVIDFNTRLPLTQDQIDVRSASCTNLDLLMTAVKEDHPEHVICLYLDDDNALNMIATEMPRNTLRLMLHDALSMSE